MNLIEIKHIEDCFDGSFIRNFIFDEPVTYNFIQYLEKKGVLKYFKDFPRPFYQVINNDFIIKGVEGNNYFQVTFFYKEKYSEKELSVFVQQTI
jgi:hypothetical protein